ncbi:ribokinase [Pelagibius litoralis]|uniref:Ribokinase n=1 Tax=Pelagibius litoralis TaxID=374515 RepID=A0A967F236_9PROT|nr:PfkB family carbohydrate kinase [Pelagibius litoralis]NIA71724.1 ribokinase [Pelagibius litoralis]
MTAPRMLHMGGAVVDYVYRIAALPPRGGEAVAGAHARIAGGGFNQMCAARRNGLAVAYGGGHGSGPDGDFLRAALTGAGIEVLLPRSATIDSGNCVVMIDEAGERSFVSWPGAESRLSDAELSAVHPQRGDWIVVSGYTLSYADSREPLHRWLTSLPPDLPVIFDPAPVVAAIPEEILHAVLARATWVSANLAEARVLTGENIPERQAAVLLEHHCPAAEGILLRAGAEGAYLQQRGEPQTRLPAFAVEAVDTNGAGDTHLGVFVAALARNETACDAAQRANAAAAISVTRFGGSAAPTGGEIDTFLAGQQPDAPNAAPPKTVQNQ